MLGRLVWAEIMDKAPSMGFSFSCLSSSYLLVQSLVNVGNFSHPALPFSVLQGHDLLMGPVEVIGDVGYLLKQTV
jgi:hypothetical protein